MGFLWMGIGLLFFLNPHVGILDILPDFLGAGFILFALRKPSMMFEKLERCHKYVLALFVVSLFQFAFGFLDGSFSGSDSMAATLIFAILSALFFILFISYLTVGITDMFMYSQQKQLEPEEVAILQRVDKVKVLSILFVLFRNLFSLLPELVHLQLYDGLSYTFGEYDLTGIYPYFQWISCIVVSVGGILWGVYVLKTFRMIQRDSALMNVLCGRYEREIVQRPERILWNNYVSYDLYLLGFSVFSVSFLFNGSNCFFPFVSVLFALMMMIRLKGNILSYLTAGLLAVLSVCMTVLQYRFFAEYSLESLSVIASARNSFYWLLGFTIAKSMIHLFFTCQLAVLLKKEIRKVMSFVGIDGSQPESLQDKEAIHILKRKAVLALNSLLLIPALDVLYLLFGEANSYLFIVILYFMDALSLYLVYNFRHFLRSYPYNILKERV